MSVVMALYIVVLFVVLTPGVFVKLPPKAGKLTVALTHAVVFAVVYQLTHRFVWRALEGFANPSGLINPNKAKEVAAANAAANATPGAKKGERCSHNEDCKSNNCEKKNDGLQYGRCA